MLAVRVRDARSSWPTCPLQCSVQLPFRPRKKSPSAIEVSYAREAKEARKRFDGIAVPRVWACAEECVGCYHSNSRCGRSCLVWRGGRTAAGVAVMR